MAKATAEVALTAREMEAIVSHFRLRVGYGPLVEKIHAAMPEVRKAQRVKNREAKAKREAKSGA